MTLVCLIVTNSENLYSGGSQGSALLHLTENLDCANMRTKQSPCSMVIESVMVAG